MSGDLRGARALRVVQALSDLDEDQLVWLAECARFVTLEPGEALFREGDPADVMFGVLDGEMRAKREQGPPDGRMFVRGPGQIGGMLPHTRLDVFPVTARATLPTRLACWNRADFPELLRRIPVLQSRLASIMADRVRETARYDQQRDKLTSLGKMAAGLAHEINNPTAAIRRSAEELARRLGAFGDVVSAALAGVVPRERLTELEELARRPPPQEHTAQGPGPTDQLARMEVEEGLATWLTLQGVSEAWSRAEAFVAAGVGADDLDVATRDLPAERRRAVVLWLEAELASRALLRELDEAAGRIAALVAAVTTFSHMDRAPVRGDVDVRDGIRSTLAIMAHGLRAKGIVVREEHAADLPSVHGNAGELNQVWLNLIDNAIDAVADGGSITIRTSSTGPEVLVEVIDDGPGIPSDIRWRIFEPFFTTKEVGGGTGIGLDVVSRIVAAHGGDVRVDSSPRGTRFGVLLPRTRSATASGEHESGDHEAP